MSVSRIEPLEPQLLSSRAWEAMDMAGGNASLIPRLEALESTCQGLQLLHDKTAKNMLGTLPEAAGAQQGFSQIRSCMEILQELLQVVAQERAERTKALHEAKLRLDECFETMDSRLAGIVNCRVGFARLVSELKAELRSEMANRIQTLTLEIRSEALNEFALLEKKTDARMKLLETRLTGDLKANCEDLGMRINQVDDEVKRNSKMVTSLDEKTARVVAIQAIEKETCGALVQEDAKHGGKRSCSPKGALMRSASSIDVVHTQHMSLAPVDRSNLVRTGDTSRGEIFENKQDSFQTLQGLVKAHPHHRTSPKTGTSSVPVRIPEELPTVIKQLDSEPSTTEPGSSSGSAATPSIVSRRPNIGSAEMACALSRKLVQRLSSRQTTSSTGIATAKTEESSMALQQRISPLPTSPALSSRSLPTRQSLLKKTLSSAHISSTCDGHAIKAATAAAQYQIVDQHPTRSRYLV